MLYVTLDLRGRNLSNVVPTRAELWSTHTERPKDATVSQRSAGSDDDIHAHSLNTVLDRLITQNPPFSLIKMKLSVCLIQQHTTKILEGEWRYNPVTSYPRYPLFSQSRIQSAIHFTT
jgi:hypothetical protein